MRKLVALAIAGISAGSVAVASPQGTGLASWYGPWHEGRIMANGHPYHARGLTAASRTFPLGTLVRVRRDNRAVVVEITDRGPYVSGRVLDLSRRAAERLGMVEAGVVPVRVEEIRPRHRGSHVAAGRPRNGLGRRKAEWSVL